MQWLIELFTKYDMAVRANPMMATLALPVVAGLMYYIKDIPRKIWKTLVRCTTVTMSLNNAGWDGNVDAYNAFDKWFMQSGYNRFSRNFFMFRQHHEDLFNNEIYKPFRIGIGKGLHLFRYKGKFFWFTKGNLESSGSERQKEEILIKAFGWNFKVFEELTDLFNTKKSGDKEITIHTYHGANNGWQESGLVPTRDIETFCMNEELKKRIVDKFDRFFSSREWYRKKGLTYKISSLFKGPPGTGKTTLSKLLASHFKRDLYILDLSGLTNTLLVDALSKIRPGSFLLLEDIDAAGSAVTKRDAPKDLGEAFMDIGGITMSGMLNAIDGAISLDNIVILMTTNHPEKLDDAIRRKSRIDDEFLIDELGPNEVKKYIIQMYEVSDEAANEAVIRLRAIGFKLPGCEVENAFKEHPDDHHEFVADLYGRCDERLRLVA